MSGGTMEFFVRDLENWQTAVCTRCCRFLEDYYYVHQCRYKIPHRWCYQCLVEKGDCLRCGLQFSMILNPFLYGVANHEVSLNIGEMIIDENLDGDWNWDEMFFESSNQLPECEFCQECDECKQLVSEI